MKATQKIQVTFAFNGQSISFYTTKKKTKDVFDFYTSEAVNAALSSMESDKSIGIVGEFGTTGIKRSLQVRLID